VPGARTLRLTKARANQRVDKIVKCRGDLRAAKHMTDQFLRELGSRNPNNLYLYDDLVTVSVLAELLAEKMGQLVTATETVSWHV